MIKILKNNLRNNSYNYTFQEIIFLNQAHSRNIFNETNEYIFNQIFEKYFLTGRVLYQSMEDIIFLNQIIKEILFLI